jgi:hypothetical protein
MDHVCVALPIRAGKSDDARRFAQQLDGERRADFDRSERRIGISKELWYLAKLPSGDHLIGYMEAVDFNKAFEAFVGSREPFDMWFKQQFLDVTGIDLNSPPPDFEPAALLTHYEASTAAV